MGLLAMNDSAIRQGNNPYFVAIATAVIGTICGYFGATANTNYAAQIANQSSIQSAQSAELRADALELGHVKDDAKNVQAEMSRVESIALAAQASANVVVNQLGALKTALDAQTEGFHALQKQVGDMDRWLRPDPSLGGGRTR